MVAIALAAALGAYLVGRSSVDAGQAEVAVREAEAAKQALVQVTALHAAEVARIDSVHVAKEQEIATERERAEARARQAELRAGALAMRLRERVDVDTRPLLDSLTTAHAEEVTELRTIIAGADSLAASLRGQVMTRDALIGALQDELTATERVAELWKARYERETSWWRGFKKSSGTLLVGAAVGAVAVAVLGG